MNKTQYTPTAAEIKARTYEATVSNIFAAKAKRDNAFEAMVALSQAADKDFNWDTGLLLLAA